MIEHVEKYIACRDLSPTYAAALRQRVAAFCRWAGLIQIHEVTADRVNAWLAHLANAGQLGDKTRREYRAAVLAVWRDAWQLGLTEHRPERVRPVRVRHSVPVAWSLDEVRKLLTACQRLPGRVKGTQIARSAWFDRFCRLAWYTGMRLSDLLTARASDLASNGVLRLTTHKTSQPLAVRLPANFAAGLPKTGPILPWPGCRRQVYHWIERLVRLAEIRPGSSRWLRRSAASYVEREQPGAARLLLGHRSPEMAERHYLDPAITGRLPPMPPAL